MPGLTLWLGGSDSSAPEMDSRFVAAQRTMQYGSDYLSVLDFTSERCRLGHVTYPEYPWSRFQTPTAVVTIEGRVFGEADAALRSGLTELAHDALREPDPAPRVRQWMMNHDGDYVIAMTRVDGSRLLLFSDPLGRLPLYLHVGPTETIVARECKFINALRARFDYDRLAWAEYLWLGYPLGQRTLYSGVSRLPGGLFLRADEVREGLTPEVLSLYRFNFEEKDDPSLSVGEYASRLADVFRNCATESVRTERPSPIVVSLSGGNDSRSIAAALRGADVSFEAATFRSFATGKGVADAVTAERIARLLGIPWRLIELAELDPCDEESLVRMKDGLNYVGVAFLLPFLRQILSMWGRSTLYVTGDGGDKAMPDLRPDQPIRAERELLDSVERGHSIVDSGFAESLVGLAVGTLREQLASLLESYPERDPVQKAIHFKYYERGRKWLFEGEDRNRFFFWQVSPFYAFSFLEMAMKVPDRLKAGYRLYREFQRCLNPAIVEIPDPSVGFSISSPAYRWSLQVRAAARRLPLRWKSRLKGALGGQARVSQMPSRAIEYIRHPRREAGGHDVWKMSPERMQAALESTSSEEFRTWWTLGLLDDLAMPRGLPREIRDEGFA